ncbi:TIGR00725 family protein [Kitasatospora cinereorecta]|uniref:TIGR00725 family protein n=1 Tax=Kitasatospora cinereorecta TaxID=285560 RepID=A0ABW0VH83_9ACTN
MTAAEPSAGPSAPPYVAVVGPGDAGPEQCAAAEAVGRLLAGRGAVVVCGGLGGVMAAAARGARDGGGMSVGLLPGRDRSAGNPYLTLALPTGMGQLRNGLVVAAADAVIAVGGSWGTLSEIALALRAGLPVIALGGWRVDGPQPQRPSGSPGPAPADTPEAAVAAALAAVSGRTQDS